MKWAWGIIIILGVFLFSSDIVRADEADIFMSKIQPNILFILDNSNSMDEDFYGNCVGSWATGSRSVEAKKALQTIVNSYASKMRIGLMSYALNPPSPYQLHNSLYFASYDLKSYCPNPPAECQDYCITNDAAKQSTCQASCAAQNPSFDATYRDAIITYYPAGSEQRTRYCNNVYPKTNYYAFPANATVYYKLPGTFYDPNNYGTDFCYAYAYSPDENVADTYTCWTQKAGTNDDYPNNYGGSNNMGGTFYPTDEDFALGYWDFGMRMAWYYVGRTWYGNSSPGGGLLLVPAATNNTPVNAQQTLLINQLTTHEGDQTGYMNCGYPDPNCIINAGLTPTAGTLQSAINYFQGTYSGYGSPITDHCQKNFIVYATDGLPSVNETGGSGKAVDLMPAVLGKIDALRSLTKSLTGTSYNFDINTYILGMGLNETDKGSVDAMAIHGGTAVGGHAYYADDPSQLTTGLNNTLADILERAFSFTTTSVASSRIADEDYLYEASFEPVNFESFWRGHIKKYSINSDGSINSTALWDAGSVLQAQSASGRNIMTYKSGSLVAFQAANISRSDLGASTDAQRDAIVGYIRGDSTYNPDNWKLGDIFHSNIISVGTPSAYFNDTRDSSKDSNGRNAFAAFRAAASNQRTSANGKRVLIAGANDGQFHAFKASDGSEYWSFVPPNLMPKLQYLAHSSNPTNLYHQYLADGPVVVSDAWVGSGDGKSKSANNWITLAILSVGRNDNIYDNTTAVNSTNYWSSSTSCDSGFSSTYDNVNAPYYCGYYAFDFTDTLNPAFKWRLSGLTTSTAPYLGEPWGKMAIGKVIISGNEKWVGFIGGGYNYCNGSNCSDNRGKGFFVVDLSNGNIIWSSTGMTYSIPASPAMADTDADGFIDTVYVGDLGGNMWRFNLCTQAQGTSCTTADWTGGKLYNASGEGPIYTSITGAKDTVGNFWVYWGTGDKVNPISATGGNFYAVKDNDRSSTYTLSSLKNISSSSATFNPSSDTSKDGWYINLPNAGEKVLADPIVFGGAIYFSTYTPYLGTDQCLAAGTGTLYGINYITGSSVSGVSTNRVIGAGTGLATSPIVSIGPTSQGGSADLYVTFSGGGSAGLGLDEQIKHEGNIPSDPIGSKMLYWRDRRLQ
jgi:type IV pilus assembly protein PilY1